MKEIRKQLSETVPFLQSKTQLKPKVGIVLGTGMGKVAEIIDSETVIPFEEVPHFVKSTVEGQSGNLISGTIGDVPVMTMQGRFHYHEGYDLKTVTYPIRLMKALGVEAVILTNAAGGLNPLFRAGDIMLITDQINLLGDNPLRGENVPELGPRFPDMSRAYTSELRDLAEGTALELGIRLMQGVYVAVGGPSLETAAEDRFLRLIGADVVGMSTVPECIVAVQSGMRVLGFSAITDMCLPDSLVPATLEEIIKVADIAAEKLSKLLENIIVRM